MVLDKEMVSNEDNYEEVDFYITKDQIQKWNKEIKELMLEEEMQERLN